MLARSAERYEGTSPHRFESRDPTTGLVAADPFLSEAQRLRALQANITESVAFVHGLPSFTQVINALIASGIINHQKRLVYTAKDLATLKEEIAQHMGDIRAKKVRAAAKAIQTKPRTVAPEDVVTDRCLDD
ncbi:MAG: hypothetical protein R3C68_13540 [Myxococcota bacterium]